LHLLILGCGAATLVLLSDFTVGIWLRGIAFAEQLAYFSTPAGRLYLSLIAIFALAPLVLVRWRS
jgi:hypothetical protein